MRTRPLVLPAIVAAACFAPAAAFWVPQTRQEFVEAVAAGKGATAMETITVGRALGDVYAVLEEKVGACLDVTVSRTAYVGYVENSSTEYNPKLERTADGRAEFTLQVVHNPRGVGHTPPAGGLYFMAADLRAVDANHTEVVLYRPTIGAKKIVASLKEWLDAQPAPCPKLK